ncbi:MAG: prevent-host-death protein [Chloroflexi bacterium]|nr:prevent-host-death protein [Chloroflexota bacterium]
MVQISVDKAQIGLLDLINAAIRGERVWIIADRQRAVQLVPVSRPVRHRQFGSAKGLITMADDFDAPMPDFSEYTE